MSLDLFFRGNLFTFLSRLAYKLGDFIYICRVQTLLFNPWNDLALAANDPHYTPPASARQMAADLADLSRLWSPDDSCAPFLPWGWSPLQVRLLREAGVPEEQLPTAEQLEEYRACSSRQRAVGLLAALRQALATRTDCVPFWNRIVGESVWCTTEEEVREAHARYGESMLKAPWSSSGRGVHPAHGGVLDGKTAAWVRRTLARQGGIEAEPIYNKVQDLAMEFWVEPLMPRTDVSSEQARRVVRYEGLSLFATTDGGVYDGNLVASEQEKEARVARYIPMALLRAVRETLLELLAVEGSLASWYRGPVGIDMMIVDDSSFSLHPFVELNHRMTMGWLACLLFQREPQGCRRFRIVQEAGRYRYELS